MNSIKIFKDVTLYIELSHSNYILVTKCEPHFTNIKQDIINKYQLIYLRNPILGYYRSRKNINLVPIRIITIEYLHKDKDKKSYNPGITFIYITVSYNKENHKKFLNFSDQICILDNITGLQNAKKLTNQIYNFMCSSRR